MRQRTELEVATDRGGLIRLEVSEHRSLLKPQWWDALGRFRWWRLKKDVQSYRKRLDPETQLALAWAEEALEREFLFGKGRMDIP